MVGGSRKLMPGEGYDRNDWKKQEENHTKPFAQSDALSRGSFLKVMLTGAASALSAGTGFARSLQSPVSRQSTPLVRGSTTCHGPGIRARAEWSGSLPMPGDSPRLWQCSNHSFGRKCPRPSSEYRLVCKGGLRGDVSLDGLHRT